MVEGQLVQGSREERPEWPSAILVRNKIFRLSDLTNLKLDILESMGCEDQVDVALLEKSEQRYVELLGLLEKERNTSRDMLRSLSEQCQRLAEENRALQLGLQRKESEFNSEREQLESKVKGTQLNKELTQVKKNYKVLLGAREEADQLEKENEELIRSLVKYRSVVEQAENEIILLKEENDRLKRGLRI